MYREHIVTVLELMDQCNRDKQGLQDFIDLRRIVNRHMRRMTDEFPKSSKLSSSRYNWVDDESFDYRLREAGIKLCEFLNNGYRSAKLYRDDGGSKIQLIKKLREFGPKRLNAMSNEESIFGLLECKQFVEKYFSEWC